MPTVTRWFWICMTRGCERRSAAAEFATEAERDADVTAHGHADVARWSTIAMDLPRNL